MKNQINSMYNLYSLYTHSTLTRSLTHSPIGIQSISQEICCTMRDETISLHLSHAQSSLSRSSLHRLTGEHSHWTTGPSVDLIVYQMLQALHVCKYVCVCVCRYTCIYAIRWHPIYKQITVNELCPTEQLTHLRSVLILIQYKDTHRHSNTPGKRWVQRKWVSPAVCPCDHCTDTRCRASDTHFPSNNLRCSRRWYCPWTAWHRLHCPANNSLCL